MNGDTLFDLHDTRVVNSGGLPARRVVEAEEAAAKAADAQKAALEHADREWRAVAHDVVVAWSKSKREGFTSDDIMDVMDALECTTHDRRALGPVIAVLARQKVIVRTGATAASTRRNGSKIPVWVGAVFADERSAQDPWTPVLRFIELNPGCTVGDVTAEIHRLQAL